MPAITPNQPITQTSPVLKITNQLPVGKHRFELVVIDDAGQASKTAHVIVHVQRRTQRGRFDRIVVDDRLRVDDRIRFPVNPPIRR